MATYEEIRAEHLAHLRTLPEVMARVDRVMRDSQFGSTRWVTADEMKEAFDEQAEWNRKLLDIYRREDEARPR